MCWEIGAPNLDTDFWEVVPKYFDTTISVDPIPTVHQEDLHLNTNTRNQLYMRTQLFIHYNLVQYKILALFMWLPYHDTNTLYGNFDISYLSSLMSWYGKRGGGTTIYTTPWLI